MLSTKKSSKSKPNTPFQDMVLGIAEADEDESNYDDVLQEDEQKYYDQCPQLKHMVDDIKKHSEDLYHRFYSY